MRKLALSEKVCRFHHKSGMIASEVLRQLLECGRYTMLELLEKAVMTTIGVAAITQKKAEELAAEMKERFKLSEEEGKGLVDKFQTMAKENREKVTAMAEHEVQKVVERLGLVSREEYDRLAKRVQELESRTNG
jgi:polyhydroxyalkanoate synthesis regulator phasin